MSKKSNGHNGNGHNGRRNGNGHNGNGNGKAKPKKPPAEKSAKKKPPAKKPTSKQQALDRLSGSAMVVHRNDGKTPMRSALDSEPDGHRPLGERIDNMGASHVAAAATGAGVSSALAYGAIANGYIKPKNSAIVQMALGAATTWMGHRGNHDHIMMAGAGIASAGLFSMANQLSVDGYEAIEKRAEKRKAEKEAKEKEEKEEKGKKQRNARRLVIVADNSPSSDDDFAHREAAGDAA